MIFDRGRTQLFYAALLLAGIASACGSPGDPAFDDSAVTGAGDVELPEPVDCRATEVADRLRWTGGGDLVQGRGIRAVAVHGEHGFTCAEVGGLGQWDLSADAPRLVSESDASCRALATDGTWLAVAVGEQVRLRTIEEPSIVATWTAPAPVESLTASQGRLLVAAGAGGWAELDLEEGLAERAAFVDLDSDSRAIAPFADFIYVADARAGLRVFDSAGVLQGSMAVDPALDVVAHAGGLAIATLEGVAWVDVDAPSTPAIAGVVTTPGSALGVEVVDGHLVSADFTDVALASSEETPRLLSVEPLVGDDLLDRTRALALDPVSGRLYVAQWDSLHAYDTRCDGAAPSLWPDRRTLDFRNVSPGRSRALAVSLRNEGDAPLRVAEVRSSFPEVTTDFEPVTVQPGGAAAFEVTFVSPDPQPYTGTLELVSDDPDQPVFVLPMSANVRGIRQGEPMVPFRNVDTLGRVWEPDDATDEVLLLAYFADW